MKLTTILLIVGFLQVSARGFSQTVSLSGTGLTLKEVFAHAEKQTGYYFLFKGADLKDLKPVTFSAVDMPLEDFLRMVLAGQPLEFKVRQNNIAIFRKATDPSWMLSQPITGMIRDQAGNVLAGATISVKGTKISVISDKDGSFTVNANIGDQITITYVGFQTQTLVISSASLGTIALKPMETALNEVTVSGGYYQTTKKLATGNISKVSGEDIAKQPVSDPMLALQGRVPGLYIESRSGRPGSGVTVSIRGKNSLQNGLDPLYIVDGVPFASQSLSGTYVQQTFGPTSPFYNLNPNDIESIEVLKDADATAIYGSRAANGVILITTKKGRPGKATLNAEVSTGTSKVTRFLDLMNTEEYLQMRHQAFINDNRAVEDFHYDVNGVWDTTRYTDWQKELLTGTARYTTAQASISGGKDHTTYIFSGTFQQQSTIFSQNDKERKGALLFSVTNQSPNEKFSSNFSVNYIVNKSDMLAGDYTLTAVTLPPNAPALYKEDGSLNWENSTFENPLAGTKALFDFESHNLLSNVRLGYKILPRLEIFSTFSINRMTRDEKLIYPSSMYDPALQMTSANSQVVTTSASLKTWNAEPQISWEANTGYRGHLKVVGGLTFQRQEVRSLSFRYEDFPSDLVLNNLQAARISDNQGSSKSIYKYNAAFARVNYTLADRYIVSLSGRRDGSSRFGPGRQFANFGSIGAAWIFSEEDFAQNIPFLSFGKIRSSYGVTGNDQIGDYQYLNTYSPGYGAYNGTSGIAVTRLFNPDYAWETTNKFEFALEMNMLKNRVTLEAAYYRNRSSNQLVSYTLSSVTGFTGVLRNFPAKIQNSGFELALSSRNTTGPLQWNTTFNLSIGRNKLIEFDNLEASSYSEQYVIGRSLNISKRFNALGVDPQTGLYQFEDMNKDGAISFADRMLVAERLQKYFGGMGNSFVYKNWSLEIFLQFVNKNASNVINTFYQSPGRRSNQPRFILNDTWTDHGQTPTYQRLTTNRGDVSEAYDRYTYSQKGLVDASFIRVKNVAASYKFPKKWLKGVGLTLFAQGQNLFTFTGYEGLDPETGYSGFLPTLRTIVFGGRINL